jgi:CubicO group peptidase (beta-lactamase class C family)
MLRYLRAHLGEAPGELRAALELVQRPRFTVTPTMKVALGWHTMTLPASRRPAIWHNGGTGGFTTFTAFCPSKNTGVVLLANKGGASDIDPIGTAMLDSL